MQIIRNILTLLCALITIAGGYTIVAGIVGGFGADNLAGHIIVTGAGLVIIGSANYVAYILQHRNFERVLDLYFWFVNV